MTPPPTPFFLDAEAGRPGRRFCIFHPPAQGPARGAIVQVPAFAEEMNKSRRMSALQARAWAEHGFAVLQIDLLGCGDSSGDFGDATWADWVADVRHAAAWLRERVDAPLWLWGLRAGALLACDAAAAIDARCHLVFWQPILAGRSVVQQFLRLKAAADLGDGQMKAALDDARIRLAAGDSLEIAGYLLTARLAERLQSAKLQPPSPGSAVVWLEVSAREEPALLPASLEMATRWREAGHDVQARAVGGPAFWQTVEIEVAPALLAATLDAVAPAKEAIR